MAIITFGSLIISMSGKHGSQVFYRRRGTDCARLYVVPRNPDTQSQRIVRRSFAEAVRSWQAMSEDKRDTFNKKARFLNMSGYNLYISRYMRVETQDLASPQDLASLQNSQSIQHTDTAASDSLPLRFPSVPKPYTKASGATAAACPLKPCPG